MKNFEVTFIVDPVLSGDEIKATAQVYEQMLKNESCDILHIDEMGLKPLAYSINKRSSGVYYCIEFSNETGKLIPKLELSLKRDERIMRFLTISLDKYGMKYNADKRAGLIGKVQKKVKPKREDGVAPPPVAAAPVAAAPVAAAPAAPAPIVEKIEEAPIVDVVAPVVAAAVAAPAVEEVVAPAVEEVAAPAVEAEVAGPTANEEE